LVDIADKHGTRIACAYSSFITVIKEYPRRRRRLPAKSRRLGTLASARQLRARLLERRVRDARWIFDSAKTGGWEGRGSLTTARYRERALLTDPRRGYVDGRPRYDPGTYDSYCARSRNERSLHDLPLLDPAGSPLQRSIDREQRSARAGRRRCPRASI